MSTESQSNEKAVIRHISGARRGQVRPLEAKTLFIVREDERDVRIVVPDHLTDIDVIATLHRHGNTYELEVSESQEVWVNGDRVTENRVLVSGDLIELCHAGPVIRFRIYPPGVVPKKTLAEALADSLDSARAEGHSGIARAGRFLARFTHDLATQTTIWFRIWTLVLIGLIILSLALLVMQNYRFQEQLHSESLRLEGIARLLEVTGEKSMTREEFARLQEEIGSQLVQTGQRLESLELQQDAAGRVIGDATGSIAFLQGQYGFSDPETGRLLRYLVTPHGVLFFTAEDLAEEGNLVRIDFSGTAFVVSDRGLLLTNHHIAEPWLMRGEEEQPEFETMAPQVFELRAFLPGHKSEFEATVVKSDPEVDLALLEISPGDIPLRSLELGTDPPVVGEEILVMGYPLGLSGMLARVGPDFLDDLEAADAPTAWDLVDRLAEQSLIKPLASLGIVSQLSEQYIVYDAETTLGGSGGPVFNLEGKVIGINTAIMKQFGGSNLGIPVAYARKLLESAGMLPKP